MLYIVALIINVRKFIGLSSYITSYNMLFYKSSIILNLTIMKTEMKMIGYKPSCKKCNAHWPMGATWCNWTDLKPQPQF